MNNTHQSDAVTIDADLQRSVDKGHITQEQALVIMADRHEYQQEHQQKSPSVSVGAPNHTVADSEQSLQDEPLKFIRNFSDIFISIGIVIVFSVTLFAPPSLLIDIASAAGLVVLSEWLVRKRHLVLPGMTLLVMLILFIFKVYPFDMSQLWNPSGIDDVSGVIRNNLLMAFGLSALVSGAYFWRYKLPFSAFTGGLSLIWLAVTFWQPENTLAFMWGAGMLVFIAAMVFDALDTRRVSYVSDVGFWLHLVAAPMLTHVFIILFGASGSSLLFYGFMILISLLVDRRAILLASVVYFVYNSFNLFGNGNFSFLMFLFIIGSMILLLGGFWYDIRNRLFGWVGKTPLGNWLPSFHDHKR